MPKRKIDPEYFHIAYIGLGSNLGDRQIFLAYGIRRLSRIDESWIQCYSGLYATEPVGIEERLPFLNMVVKYYTPLGVYELLECLKQFERDAGRTDNRNTKSRVLDLDILFYDNDIITENTLIIPHPELHKRRFVLEPLAEIAGDLNHPVERKTIQQLLDECPTDYWVRRVY